MLKIIMLWVYLIKDLLDALEKAEEELREKKKKKERSDF